METRSGCSRRILLKPTKKRGCLRAKSFPSSFTRSSICEYRVRDCSKIVAVLMAQNKFDDTWQTEALLDRSMSGVQPDNQALR
jgi:hypothetical protein